MGFYPVCPASTEYLLASPIFNRLKVNLSNGKTFTIEAPLTSEENKFVRSATLNEVPLPHPFITHQDITSGATLRMEMTNQPVTTP